MDAMDVPEQEGAAAGALSESIRGRQNVGAKVWVCETGCARAIAEAVTMTDNDTKRAEARVRRITPESIPKECAEAEAERTQAVGAWWQAEQTWPQSRPA